MPKRNFVVCRGPGSISWVLTHEKSLKLKISFINLLIYLAVVHEVDGPSRVEVLCGSLSTNCSYRVCTSRHADI